ncbi:hypothetical protein KI387_000048, partial [Taxus chinensis]
ICRKLAGTVIFVLLGRLSFVVCQPGFLSIDCGGKQNRTDPKTNITWVTDDSYIADRGHKADINDTSLPFYFQTVRVFSKPLNKSCYKLPVIPHVPHLLRAWFYGGTFNGLQQMPRFDISIETMDTLSEINVPVQRTQKPVNGERILVTAGEVVFFCLIRNSDQEDDLFISAIELRTLEKGMYDVVKPGLMLRRLQRYDMGGQSTEVIRYPQDPFDRLWVPQSIEGAYNVSLKQTISTNNTQNLPPTDVMQTAVVGGESMYFPLIQSEVPQTTMSYLLVLYFAEIEALNRSESRIFQVSINNESISIANISLHGDSSSKEMAFQSETAMLGFKLQRAFLSGRDPLLNAFEYFQLFVTKPVTSSVDAEALSVVKQEFNIDNWVSDPCFLHPWEGILCTNATSSVRVSEINLSGKRLTGSIPPSFAELTELIQLSLDNNHLTGGLPNLSSLSKLETLRLGNNSLSGSVPDWLFDLHNLRELVIENNNFSGVIPRNLLNRPTLNIRYGGNQYLCMNKGDCVPSQSNRSKAKIIVASLIACGAVIIALVGILVFRKNHRRHRRVRIPDHSTVLVPNSSKSHAFTPHDMVTATKNFSHKIGQGGFGSVFWGKLPGGKQIAVKALTLFSEQGAAQFLNEIDLLSRVNHKNLVSLLGYSNAHRDLMLVYEYMSEGSLNDHLYGHDDLKYPQLEWRTRLKIALDAAQGLEYLHVGCTPKIIHRDVKTANILLDSNLNGKLADFGLSKMAMDEETSQVFTAVRGTVGYMDPKYFSSHMLTEKSDVYSFGVVLLEIICGRRPIDIRVPEERLVLVKWVTPFVEQGEGSQQLSEIVDKRLDNNYDMTSLGIVAKLAIRCIAEEPSNRPTISEVVLEMKEALKFEKDKDATLVAEND